MKSWNNHNRVFGSKRSALIGRHFRLYRGKYIKVIAQQPNFRNDFVRIHLHLSKISPMFLRCEMFSPFDFIYLFFYTSKSYYISAVELRKLSYVKEDI